MMQMNMRTERELRELILFVSLPQQRTAVPAQSWGDLLMEVLAATATKGRERARVHARRGGAA